jgi:hypothetical protein
MLLAAAGAATFAKHAAALTPAEDWRDIWPEIEVGDFSMAAQRLELHVNEWPLDHEARTSLAIMQFSGGSFAAAAQNLERQIKLRKGYARTETTSIDFDAVECWYYLANLRAGRDLQVPPAPHQPSLLSLLSGQIKLNDFLEEGLAAQDAVYEKMEPAMKLIAETLQQAMEETTGKRIGPAFSYERPDKPTLIAGLTCQARLMLGEQAMGLEEMTAAQTHFAATVATKADSMVEYHIGKAELARLR